MPEQRCSGGPSCTPGLWATWWAHSVQASWSPSACPLGTVAAAGGGQQETSWSCSGALAPTQDVSPRAGRASWQEAAGFPTSRPLPGPEGSREREETSGRAGPRLADGGVVGDGCSRARPLGRLLHPSGCICFSLGILISSPNTSEDVSQKGGQHLSPARTLAGVLCFFARLFSWLLCFLAVIFNAILYQLSGAAWTDLRAPVRLKA